MKVSLDARGRGLLRGRRTAKVALRLTAGGGGQPTTSRVTVTRSAKRG